MQQTHCSVCTQPLGAPIYTSGEGQSLTSLCRIRDGETRVFACRSCGHLQTSAMLNVDAYYDSDYDILIDSEDEDQIYEVRAGKPIYRTQHQVEVLQSKIDLTHNIDLLDYGCAKGSTLRALCSITPNVTPYAFDVSTRYVPFWEKFIARGNWAVNTPPAQWASRFDVVTSFFSMEHIPTVAATIGEIARLLKPGGTFYCVVPNVFGNSADFIVIDHCNHFTATSLKYLFGKVGLTLHEIDDQAHRGAFVVTARRPLVTKSMRAGVSATEVQQTMDKSSAIASFWHEAALRVRAFESELGSRDALAVYGAGFYAAFIASCLTNPERVTCYLDQNPFLQAKPFNARPVLPPDALPDDVTTLLVGLNPAHAKSIIADIPSLSRRNLNSFYL